MSSGTFLYPNVTSLPQTSDSGKGHSNRKLEGAPGEFDRVFEKELESAKESRDLDQIRAPLKFSAHASQRLRDRNIALDPMTMAKVNEAVNKAEAKGIEDTLVLTQDAALIVNVKNRTVITAMDKGSMTGNVFTNIDGAIIV